MSCLSILANILGRLLATAEQLYFTRWVLISRFLGEARDLVDIDTS